MKLKHILIIIIALLVVFIFSQNFLNKEKDTTIDNEPKIETPRSTDTLETDNYLVKVQGCEEFVVSCNDVVYEGLNKNTQESIKIENGKTLSTTCADGVTPCRFIGYQFLNDGYTYSVYSEGSLVVTDSENNIILEEAGKWGWEKEEVLVEETLEKITLDSTEGSKYVKEFIHLIALLDEDITNFNQLTFEDTSDIIAVQSQTLAGIGKVIERIKQNSIRISAYETSNNEFVVVHSSTTGIFYMNMKITFEKLYALEEQLLYAETEDDLKSYISQRAIIFPQVDTSIKNSLDLFTLLPGILISNNNSSELNTKLAELMVDHINDLYGKERTDNIETGDGALIAGISFIKKALSSE